MNVGVLTVHGVAKRSQVAQKGMKELGGAAVLSIADEEKNTGKGTQGIPGKGKSTQSQVADGSIPIG